MCTIMCTWGQTKQKSVNISTYLPGKNFKLWLTSLLVLYLTRIESGLVSMDNHWKQDQSGGNWSRTRPVDFGPLNTMDSYLIKIIKSLNLEI